jgi:hypothetical protein
LTGNSKEFCVSPFVIRLSFRFRSIDLSLGSARCITDQGQPSQHGYHTGRSSQFFCPLDHFRQLDAAIDNFFVRHMAFHEDQGLFLWGKDLAWYGHGHGRSLGVQVGHVATEQGLSLGGTAGFQGLIMMEGICMAWFSVFSVRSWMHGW